MHVESIVSRYCKAWGFSSSSESWQGYWLFEKIHKSL